MYLREVRFWEIFTKEPLIFNFIHKTSWFFYEKFKSDLRKSYIQQDRWILKNFQYYLNSMKHAQKILRITLSSCSWILNNKKKFHIDSHVYDKWRSFVHSWYVYIYNLFFHHPHSTSNYFPVMSTLSSAVFLKVDSECSRSNPFKNSFLIKEPPLESLLEECLRWKWKSLTSFAFGSMAQFFTLKIVPSRPLRWKSLLVLLLSSGFLSP